MSDLLWAVDAGQPKHKRLSGNMLGRAVECPQCGLYGDVYELPDGTQGVMHCVPDAFCAIWWLTKEANPSIVLGVD